MAYSIKSIAFLAVLALSFSASVARPNPHHHHHHHHHGHKRGHVGKSHNISAIYALGDTFVDTGNNNDNLASTYRCNHAPYGRDFPYHASTGRSSNGKLIVDYLVSSLGLKDTLPAYYDQTRPIDELLTGVSFGSGGSGLDDETGVLKMAPTMDKQADYFEQAIETMVIRVGEDRARQIVRDALFVVSIGTHDMVDNYYGLVALTRTEMSVPMYHDNLIARLNYFLQRLYTAGARKFMLFGMPPIGCLPSQVFSPTNIGQAALGHRDCLPDQNMEAEYYNMKLQDLISTINSKVDDIQIEYVDLYVPFMEMVDQSFVYGIERTTEGCCGGGIPLPVPLVGTSCVVGSLMCQNPDTYMFWDAINPTQVVNKHLAQTIEKNVLSKFHS